VNEADRPVEPLRDRVARAVREPVEIVPYDPAWPERFRRESEFLLTVLPPGIVGRIEHFGSTAVPGLPAKPIVDMLVEVSDLAVVRERVVPILESLGYDYFWRPTRGDDVPPFYAWFVKRDRDGRRTHHLHMVEREFHEHWDRLRFRDHLIARPDVAEAYARLKLELAARHPRDRVAYTEGKSAFIAAIMERIAAEGEAGPG
jgi:GrpB-like predicted nucleotidyltransferase (UPF0157 family)